MSKILFPGGGLTDGIMSVILSEAEGFTHSEGILSSIFFGLSKDPEIVEEPERLKALVRKKIEENKTNMEALRIEDNQKDSKENPKPPAEN